LTQSLGTELAPVAMSGIFLVFLSPFNAGIKSLPAMLPDEIFIGDFAS
jgi:hypothetical protein